MKKTIIKISILLALAFCLICICLTDEALAKDSIYAVENDKDFLQLMPLAVNDEIPILFDKRNHQKGLNLFAKQYNGEITHKSPEKILETIENKIFDSLIIANPSNPKLMAMASHIAAELNAPLIITKDLDSIYLTEDCNRKKKSF